MVIYKKGKSEPVLLYKTENYPLEAGDRVRMATGGGDGYGSLQKRPTELLQRDVTRGFVSRESAREDYGVTIEADGKGYRV